VSATTYRIRISSGGRPLVAIDDFSVAENQVTFLFGESGIGKSLICKTLYGLLDPDELGVEVNGRPYQEFLEARRTCEVQQSSFFVFQEPSSHLNPLMRIDEQLREGDLALATNEEEVLGQLWQNADSGALRRLLEVYPKPYRPSGGEKQRVLLAMAFKKMDLLARMPAGTLPTLFVFDEPTGSLDNNYRNLFLDALFTQYSRRAFTVVIITHDYSIISWVYARHRDLVPFIRFKEVSRRDDTAISQRDFSAEEYLQWLQATKPGRVGRGVGEPVLRFAPSFSVFGRDLALYADAKHSESLPLVIHRGEMVYVKAPSGVGKTTLAKVIMGLYPAERFTLDLSGLRITQETPGSIWPRAVWGSKAGMVFQHADEALDLEARVRETFAGLPLTEKLVGDRLQATLAELFEGGVSESFLDKKVKYLSGGQKQRLNLLRTLALGTDLIILDEPLNGLDFAGVQRVLRLLEERRAKGSALLLISHNEEIFDALVDQEHVYYLAERSVRPSSAR
jgi:peptide/nickel transport system ATP-binding protein